MRFHVPSEKPYNPGSVTEHNAEAPVLEEVEGAAEGGKSLRPFIAHRLVHDAEGSVTHHGDNT
jgi:hypothetical protein